MALTQEQQERLAQLRAEKQQYVNTRSYFKNRLVNGDNVLDNIEEIWAEENPPSPQNLSYGDYNQNPRILKSKLDAKAVSVHGNSNWADKLKNNINEANNYGQNNFDNWNNSQGYYDNWKTAFNEKVNNNNRRADCLELLDLCRDDVNFN